MSEHTRTAPDGGDTAVDPDALYERIERGDPVAILDVRGADEFEEWHIDGPSVEAVNVPGTEFEDGVSDEVVDTLPEGDPLVVVCAKGISSAAIAEMLRATGVDAQNLDEGMEGWARVYTATEVDRYEGAGTLYQYQRPSSGCLSYLLVAGGSAAVFDPLRAFTDRYREDVADHGAALEYAIDTHVHADHFSGVRSLADGDTVGVLPRAAMDRGVEYGDEVRPIEDGESFAVGDATVTAIHTPGHTSGMSAYLVDERVLLTGDGLFTDSVARPDLEAGDEGAESAARQLYGSLHETILTLPDDVVVAGGHTSDGERAPDGTLTATIGDLRESMGALSLDEDAFVERVLSDMPPRPANYRTIIAANLGQEDVAADIAFQLELGPNNCATSTETLRAE